MLGLLKRQALPFLEHLNGYKPAFKEARLIERLERASPFHWVRPGQQHLDAAVSWLKTAQDTSDTGGVAWGYRARRKIRSKDRLGWEAPYPETTGYIIPTLLRYADLSGDLDCVERARRMADWELDIQLADGGIQGGTLGAPAVASSTFVTGQVLFGLLAAYQRFGERRYLEAALRAGDFLLGCLDERGQFIKGHSLYCEAGAKAYEVRTGFALALLGDIARNDDYTQAAQKIADFAVSCQQSNGWFRQNDLDDHTQPLTHTIGYVLEGLEGIGRLLHRSDYLDASRRSLNAIVELVPPDGFLPGRWRHNWEPAVDWVCLTGSAQIAGVLLRTHLISSESSYLEAGGRLLGFVSWSQEITGTSVAMRGGIRGSYPFHGGYGRWCVLNWSTKFFADSVMDLLAAAPG